VHTIFSLILNGKDRDMCPAANGRRRKKGKKGKKKEKKKARKQREKKNSDLVGEMKVCQFCFEFHPS